VDRRRLIGGLGAGAALLLARGARAACRATPRDMLGPYYLPDQPAQEELCRAGKGERLVVTGRVLGLPDCRPLGGALVEVWQADARGEYTLVGGGKPDPDCLLRARVKADAEGRYRYATIPPGVYPGRPRHIHYRVGHPDYRVLVSQLYFRGDPHSERVGELAVELVKGAAGYAASFDLVLMPE
jgi:protocatechuate 3,4-dioxygenase beta subunit